MEKDKTVYLVGLGPGDPELITLKGLKAIRNSDRVIVPQSDTTGRSIARDIVLNYVSEEKLMMYFFPMTNDEKELDRKYAELAMQIEHYLEDGETVSYVTLGEPTIYSTCNYLRAKLVQRNIKALLIPAVSSVNAAACAVGLSLCKKKEHFGIYELPENTEEICDCIRRHPCVVFMKVHKKLEGLLRAVKQLMPAEAYLVRRIGLEGQHIYNLCLETPPPQAAYLSIALIRLNTATPGYGNAAAFNLCSLKDVK